MTARTTGPTAPPGPAPALAAPGGRRRALPLALALAVVGLQVTYPLLGGRTLVAVTITTVVVFAAASAAGAAAHLGARAALAGVVVAAGTGLVAESVGVATGFPFGRYAYTGTLGPQVLGVPVVVPLAWSMMAWPSLVAGRRVAAAARRPRLAVPLAAWLLASWDVFLDPQMVAAGHWRWVSSSPALPGVPGIPVTNFAGWLLVAVVVQALLHAVLPDPPRAAPQAPEALLLGWTWLGSSLAALVFFDQPGSAAWGFPAMGVVVAPHLLLLARDARRARAAPDPAAAAPGA